MESPGSISRPAEFPLGASRFQEEPSPRCEMMLAIVAITIRMDWYTSQQVRCRTIVQPTGKRNRLWQLRRSATATRPLSLPAVQAFS